MNKQPHEHGYGLRSRTQGPLNVTSSPSRVLPLNRLCVQGGFAYPLHHRVRRRRGPARQLSPWLAERSFAVTSARYDQLRRRHRCVVLASDPSKT